MDYTTLKTAIDANINTNGNQEITGAVLNSVLNQMVDDIQEQTEDELTVLGQNITDLESETDAKLTELESKESDIKSLLTGKASNYTISEDVTIPCSYKGEVIIVTATKDFAFVSYKFYDDNDKEIATIPQFGLNDQSIEKRIFLSERCSYLSIIVGEHLGTFQFSIRPTEGVADNVDVTSNEVKGLNDYLFSKETSIVTDSNVLVPCLYQGEIVVSVKTPDFAYVALSFLGENGDEVGSIAEFGINDQSIEKRIVLSKLCKSINVIMGAHLGNVEITFSPQTGLVKKVDNLVESYNNDVVGKAYAQLSSDEETIVQCNLAKGTISILYAAAQETGWVNASFYDAQGNLLGRQADTLINAGETNLFEIEVQSNVGRIVISNVNKVPRNVTISTSGSIQGSIQEIKNVISADFAISIPSIVYLRTKQEFSIWYRNIIMRSQAYFHGNYSIRCQQLTNGGYAQIGEGCTFDKFNYISDAETEFDLEIRIIDTYSDRVIASKVVHFVVKDANLVVNKTPRLCILGDSFTDANGVAKYIYQFLEDDGFAPISIGVNNADYKDYKDDAWAGYGISWFYNDYFGYHRNDRPSSDDVTYEGTLYTKNEFIEAQGQKFNFSYYMNTYHSDVDSVDCVVINIGLNDIIWYPYSDSNEISLLNKLEYIIQSIKDYDANTKVILCTITPQPRKDAFTSNTGARWLTSALAKARQEKWNNALINHFDTAEWIAKGVVIAPTSANFDTENAILSHEVNTDKFDASIKEVVTNDIHPNAIGAKYIADTIVNTIEGVL